MTGNRYVFAQAQNLTVTTTDATTTYGTVANLAGSFTLSGGNPGVANAFTASSATSVFDPASLAISSPGQGAVTTAGVGTYGLSASGTAIDGSTVAFNNAGNLSSIQPR